MKKERKERREDIILALDRLKQVQSDPNVEIERKLLAKKSIPKLKKLLIKRLLEDLD